MLNILVKNLNDAFPSLPLTHFAQLLIHRDLAQWSYHCAVDSTTGASSTPKDQASLSSLFELMVGSLLMLLVISSIMCFDGQLF
jgi:hypothetical protein